MFSLHFYLPFSHRTLIPCCVFHSTLFSVLCAPFLVHFLCPLSLLLILHARVQSVHYLHLTFYTVPTFPFSSPRTLPPYAHILLHGVFSTPYTPFTMFSNLLTPNRVLMLHSTDSAVRASRYLCHIILSVHDSPHPILSRYLSPHIPCYMPNAPLAIF